EEGHLFGSVTVENISEQLAGEGIDLDPKWIELEKPIKELGIYNLNVSILSEVTSVIKVWVVKADDDDEGAVDSDEAASPSETD
ncbi:MAG TPA: hypothetical protein EYQ08_11920, partial [Planctomycetes bacterium]|nr:hypothetical protein [Planctomycetota bacterium]